MQASQGFLNSDVSKISAIPRKIKAPRKFAANSKRSFKENCQDKLEKRKQ